MVEIPLIEKLTDHPVLRQDQIGPRLKIQEMTENIENRRVIIIVKSEEIAEAVVVKVTEIVDIGAEGEMKRIDISPEGMMRKRDHKRRFLKVRNQIKIKRKSLF